MTQDADAFTQRLNAVRQLLNDFKPERMAYLCVAVASIVLQVVIFLIFLGKDKVGWTEFLVMAGPGGMLMLTLGRILRMWSDALRYLQPATVQSPQEDA